MSERQKHKKLASAWSRYRRTRRRIDWIRVIDAACRIDAGYAIRPERIPV